MLLSFRHMHPEKQSCENSQVLLINEQKEVIAGFIKKNHEA